MTETIQYTKEQAYGEMMQAMINISGHIQMIQGWHDSLFPIKDYVNQYDSTLMYRAVDVFGKMKILNKQICKTFVKDDETSLGIMFEEIGKGISHMAKLSPENRALFIEDLEILTDKYK